MNDDQMITLLREAPIPADDPARYEAVVARGRKQDRRRTTIAAASLAVVALAGTVTAVTWHGTAKAGPQSFLVSTTNAGTARMTMHLTAGEFTQVVTGVVDFRHHAYDLRYVGGSPTSGRPSEASASGEMRAIGKDVWVAQPGTPGLEPGKHWVHLTADASKDSGFASLDPTRALDQLRADHARITKVGDASIDGRHVTEYRVVGTAHHGKDVHAVDLASSSGHVYVDDDGLLRRVTTDSGVLEIDFTDFGIAVKITPPAKDDTSEFDAGAFSGSGSSSGSGGGSTTGFSQTLTTGSGSASLTPAQKIAACARFRPLIEKSTQLTAAQKRQFLEPLCGR